MKKNDLPKSLKYRSKRKFLYVRPKKKRLDEHELPKTTQLDISKKKAFMTLLTNPNVSIETIKTFDFEYYQWLYFWYNPKSKQKVSKTFEDIPFYHSKLERDFFNLYSCIINKQKFLKEDFLELSVRFKFKEKTYQSLFSTEFGGTKQLEALEKINNQGAFYYRLPKKYTFFEMFFKDNKGTYLCNETLTLSNTKLNSLSKHLVYFGIIDKSRKDSKKPYFLNYYSKDELKKKSNFNSTKRMNFLKHSLKERGILGNTLDGTLIWDIDDISKEALKNGVLVLLSKGSLFNEFESFILKGES